VFPDRRRAHSNARGNGRHLHHSVDRRAHGRCRRFTWNIREGTRRPRGTPAAVREANVAIAAAATRARMAARTKAAPQRRRNLVRGIPRSCRRLRRAPRASRARGRSRHGTRGWSGHGPRGPRDCRQRRRPSPTPRGSIVRPNARTGTWVGNAPARGRMDVRRRPGPPQPRSPARGSPRRPRRGASMRQRPCAPTSESPWRSARPPSPAFAPPAQQPTDRADPREPEHRGALTPDPAPADRAAPATRIKPRYLPRQRSTTIHDYRPAAAPPPRVDRRWHRNPDRAADPTMVSRTSAPTARGG
jgi:hypothetical protein